MKPLIMPMHGYNMQPEFLNTVTLELEPELANALIRYARDKQISVSEAAGPVLRDWLEKARYLKP